MSEFELDICEFENKWKSPVCSKVLSRKQTLQDYLWNIHKIREDLTEHIDLSLKERGKLDELLKKLNGYKQKMVPSDYPKNDPKASPSNYAGFWSPGWC